MLIVADAMADEMAFSPGPDGPTLMTEVAYPDGENANEESSRPSTRKSSVMPTQDGVKASFSRPVTAVNTVQETATAEQEVDADETDVDETAQPVETADPPSAVVEVESEQQEPEEDEVQNIMPTVSIPEISSVPPTTDSAVDDLKPTRDIFNDADWDTDLENEDEDDTDNGTVKSQYINNCKKFGIVPASCFVRHIEDKEIAVKNHGLGLIETKVIAKALKNIITVERVNLEGNRMEEKGGSYICRMLEDNEYIQEINLSYNSLGNAGASYITKMLSTNVALRRLYLTGNNMDDNVAKHLAEALEEAKNLRELYLSKNNFGEYTGEVLGPAIGANDTLEVLDLSWNKIRRKGAVAIAKGIKDNIRLKTCNLSWNGFGEEGGTAMADALSGNSSLLILDISSNRLNLNVALKLSKTLAANDTLQTLKVGNNPMSTAGCVALAAAISNSSCQITCLDLSDNPVEYEFIKTKEELAKHRPHVSLLHGPILRAGNTSQDIGKPGVDLQRKSKKSAQFLREHLLVADARRLTELLSLHDAGGTQEISPEDLITVIQGLEVGIDIVKLRDAVKSMQKTKDNKIRYRELLDRTIQ